MIKAVLFDMDGILYDSEYYYMKGTIAQLREYGYTGPDEDVYQVIGTTMEDTYRIVYNLLGGKYDIETLARGNEEYFTVKHPIDYRKIMFRGIPEELRKIRSMGIRTAVCSSSPLKTIQDSLRAMGIEDLFDFIETGENVRASKPAPDIYLLAQESLGVKKEECLVYEDSTLGIESGKRAGIFTAAREDNRFGQDQSHADLIVRNIQELTEYIGKENHMQEVMKIEGGHLLEGEVTISGAKNATVALIPAAVLANGPVTIVGIPQIADVDSLSEILRILNVQVMEVAADHIIIDPSNMKNIDLDQDIVTKLRASYYFMGALLGKYGYVRMKMPGGCYLGPRPIDLHLKGFEALGAEVVYDTATSCYTIRADKLVGDKIFLDISSVGATINIMMAAVYAEGRTTIENAAKEPEIIDVATLLNKMGARIRGAGTNVITIDGVRSLSGCFHEIIPDRIEAGTFVIIAAAMAKKMVINNVIPQHLDALLSKLEDMGVKMEIEVDRITVERSENLSSVRITTRPYPGFATDLQQPLTALMTKAAGTSIVKDTIYTERFGHCKELNRMGADIQVANACAKISGPTPLHGAKVAATDLRCGAAMVIAGLMADGVTEISNVYHIDRGYSEIDQKLKALGAVIWREMTEETAKEAD